MTKTVADLLSQNLSGAAERKRAYLVVQGGGMRGVYSMGALEAIEDRGLTNAFDVVIGSSAGAINGAYLLANQSHDAVNVYVDFLSNKNFVNPLRLTKVVDIDYMVDDVLKKLCPLDVKAVRYAGPELEVVLTDADTCEPRVVSARDDSLDLYEVIRATAALPGLYNKKVPIDGHRYIDGGVADGVPVLLATDRADLILTVVTRAPGFRRTAASPWLKPLFKLGSLRQSRAVRRHVGIEDVRFNASMDVLEGVTPVGETKIWTVWPSSSERLVGRTTADKNRLRDCAKMGYDDMAKVLDSPVE